MVTDLMVRNGPQPAAKGFAFPFFPEAPNVRGDCLENVLEDVGEILLRHVPAPAPPQQQRRIKADHPVPGVGIIGLEPFQQAPRCSGGMERLRFILGWLIEAVHIMGRRQNEDSGEACVTSP
jgi:hypothetical protein